MIAKPIIPGKLTTNGLIMERHEYATINTLLATGYDVELLPKSRTPHSKSPDINLIGMAWEMKAPLSSQITSMERLLHRAVHQSCNVIFDLRRTKLQDQNAITALTKYFYEIRTLRNLWIINKKDEILKLKK